MRESGRAFVHYSSVDEQRYCNLGWSLTTGDIDQDGAADLVVGSPFAPAGGQQRGFVGVLKAHTKYSALLNITEEDFDWIHSGEQDYSWFGYSVVITESSQLAVGAPSFRICAREDCSYNQDDVQAVGKVYMFDSPLMNTHDWDITGLASFSQLGYSLAAGSYLGSNVLAISSVTADSFEDLNQAGEVSIYDDQGENIVTLKGDRPYGRYGSNILFTDVDGDEEDDIIITAPLRSETFLKMRESGRAFVHYSSIDEDTILGTPEEQALFGYSVAKIGKDQLVFGMPHSHGGDRLAGRVAVFHL